MFIMGVIIFPWEIICTAHPFGHAHEYHGPGELSPCEINKKYVGKGLYFLPAMHCQKASVDTDNYHAPSKFQLKPGFQMLVVIVVLVDYTCFDKSRTYIFPPELKCRSATLISENTLRGPPLI